MARVKKSKGEIAYSSNNVKTKVITRCKEHKNVDERCKNIEMSEKFM